jgi:hypothetical protein
VAFVFCTIWPLLDTFAVLFVLVPLSDIGGAVGMLVSTVPMGLVVEPLPLVNISIGMDKGTLAVGLVSLPLAIILRAILPDLLPITILHAIEQLSSVNCPITEC